VLQVVTDIATSGIREFFLAHTHLSSTLSYFLNLSGLGDPTGSHAATGLAPRVTGTYESLHHGRVEIAIYNNTNEG